MNRRKNFPLGGGQYGPSAVAGVAIGLVLLFGYRYWTQYQEQRRVDASALYEQMLAARAKKPVEAVGIANKLMGDYSATPYAGMAALTLARQQYEAGDRAAARTALSWAVANAKKVRQCTPRGCVWPGCILKLANWTQCRHWSK